MNLQEIRQKANNLINDLRTVRKQYKEEKTSLEENQLHLSNIISAQEITQCIVESIQQKAHNQIAEVVTQCLQTVFGDTYQFKIRFEKKRGRTEAELLLLKDGNEIEDPMNEDSGGVVDVAAFALRLSCIILNKPQLRKIMFLDEPFKFVSTEYRENVRLMLEGLAKDFKIQFIMVTHISEFQTGKVMEL